MFHAIEKYKTPAQILLGLIALTFVGFGASTLVVGAALSAVRYGGLVCLTHTAGALCSAQSTVVAHTYPVVLLSRGVAALRLCMGSNAHCFIDRRLHKLAGRLASCPTKAAPSMLHAGTIAGGRDPCSALALYGQHLAPVPSANEQGLRMLIGLAYREALARRLR